MDASQSLWQLIGSTYDYAVRIVGLGVFLMFLYAGFKMMFGDRKTGWSIIQDAVIGAVLLFSAYVILNSINPDLVGRTSNIPSLNSQQGGSRP